MDGARRRQRSDTRQQIQDLAFRLFAAQGYEKTSLREIAEHLDVTKAAVYYHFRTKEEILVGAFEDLTRSIQDLTEWCEDQPHTLEIKQEVIRRYGQVLADAEPVFRFVQGNQATVRKLGIGDAFRERMRGLRDVIVDPAGDLTDQVRCLSAFVALHAGGLMTGDVDGDPQKRREAVLEVAMDLVAQAHLGSRRAREVGPFSL